MRCKMIGDQYDYRAGASALAIEELQHRSSFDLDFHTREALADVPPVLVEIQRIFGEDFAVLRAPYAFGSGFGGVLRLLRWFKEIAQVRLECSGDRAHAKS